jgi:hypothetical protein
MEVKVLGIFDDVNTCDCCGKTGLKRTVALEINEEVFYCGTSCATKKHGMSKTTDLNEVKWINTYKNKCKTFEQFADNAGALKGYSAKLFKNGEQVRNSENADCWMWGQVAVYRKDF